MKLVKYLLVLLKNIYTSSFWMLWQIVKTKGALPTETVVCHLDTQGAFYQMLICIGITLTPGTLVSEKEGSVIQVLKVCDGNEAPHLAFDKIFQKGGVR